jgi:quinol---cytochrome-c reductase cytochrome c subunit
MIGSSSGAWAADSGDSELQKGKLLFETSCSSCHGIDGRGTSLGPPLTSSGAAGAHFMLTTGRMPLDDPHRQPVRKPPAFDKEEIELITKYVASLGSGPEIPRVDLRSADLAEGQELYSENCAACHSSAGAGGAIGAGMEAPPLSEATPNEIVEAMRVGPGAMPVFDETTLSEEEANSIAKYLVYLREAPDPGGLGLNRIGPIAEGFVAWMVGVVLLLGVARWIGEKE